MFLFYVVSFFQKRGHYLRGDIIQGGTLFKEIRYLGIKHYKKANKTEIFKPFKVA